MSRQAELLLDARATLAEGPVWDPRRAFLYWVNILDGEVHAFDPATGFDRIINVGRPVGCVAPRAGGGLVAALRDGFVFLDPDTGQVEPIADPEPDCPGNRFNDGAVDPAGRFWAGTIAPDATSPVAALYCLEPDRRITRKLDGIGNSNGLAWSPDEKTMYYIDTPTRVVSAFDYDKTTGAIANRRVAVRIEEDAWPDGMTIDAEGMLWIAQWGGGAVTRRDPASGREIGRIGLPAAHVSSCVFGGGQLDLLFITTARLALDEAALASQPHAGGLFVADPRTCGSSPIPFAG